MRKDRVVSEMLGDELAITPSDLYNQEFKSSIMGGYDREEVDEFLERVADVFEYLLRDSREQKEKVEELKHQVTTYQEMEHTLRNALISSQKFGENLIDSAKSQADAILEEARVIKAQAKLDAANLPDELRAEIGRLQEVRDRIQSEMRALLKTQLALLENGVQSAGEACIEDAEVNECEEESSDMHSIFEKSFDEEQEDRE